MSTQAEASQRIYNARAEKYDQSFHGQLADDYIKWFAPQPGEHVLDLACGTGLVTIPAARAGSVTGVAVSDGMLAEARRKAAAEHGELPVTFVQHDITSLQDLPGRRPEGYDAMSACSCLPLFDDPAAVVRHWAESLKLGGRLIYDTPDECSNLLSLYFERVVREVGRPMAFSRGWVRGLASVEALAREAGLDVKRSFTVNGYGLKQSYGIDAVSKKFDELANGPFGGTLENPEDRERAKALFIDKFRGLQGTDGLIADSDGFYIVIAEKPMSQHGIASASVKGN